MHQAAVVRKKELEAEEEKIKKLEREARDAIIDLEQKITAAKAESDRVDVQHTEECKLEAAGKKNDRVGCEQKLSSAAARLKGFTHLLDEKRQELKLLRANRGPEDKELSELYHQEAMEKEMAEIASETEAGMAEVNQLITLHGSLLQRIYALRQRKVNDRAGKEASIKLDQAYYRVLHS